MLSDNTIESIGKHGRKVAIFLICACVAWLCVSRLNAAVFQASVGGGNWSSASTWTNGAVPSTADTVLLTNTSGNVTIDVDTNCAALDCTGYTGVLAHVVGPTLRIYGNCTFSSAMTYAPEDGAVLILNGNGTLTTQNVKFSSLVLGNNTAVTIQLNGDVIATNQIRFSGPSSSSRFMVKSSIPGTPRTITSASISGLTENCDFQDITSAGTANWNLSAITGGSGDCGGNTGITFTPATTNYWRSFGAGASVNWSTSTNWFTTSGGTTVSRVPLPQDTAVFDANSFTNSGHTVVQNMPRFGSMIWSGVQNNPTLTTSTAASWFGDLQLDPNMTLTESSQVYTYEGRRSSTLISAGKTWAKQFTISAPGGTLSLGDAFTTSGAVYVPYGMVNFLGNSVTAETYYSTSTANTIASNSIVTLTGPNNVLYGNLVFGITGNSSDTTNTQVIFTANTSGLTLFYNPNRAFKKFTIKTLGSGTSKIASSCKIDELLIYPGRTVLFSPAISVTNNAITALGTQASPIYIGSSAAGTYTINLTGGTLQNCDWLSITNCVFGTGSTNKSYVGKHSVDGGGNVNAVFSDSGTMF